MGPGLPVCVAEAQQQLIIKAWNVVSLRGVLTRLEPKSFGWEALRGLLPSPPPRGTPGCPLLCNSHLHSFVPVTFISTPSPGTIVSLSIHPNNSKMFLNVDCFKQF